MVRLLVIVLLATALRGQSIPKGYMDEAEKYYASLDSAQWADVDYHLHYWGYRNAVFAGMEGSNRPRGDHGDEDSHQDTGIYYPTARIYAPDLSEDVLRKSLLSHFYCSALSYAVDRDNIALEVRRGSERPLLNAYCRYNGGYMWRVKLKYGLRSVAREKILRSIR